MSRPGLSDELWAIISPLLPPELSKPKRGRLCIADQALLTGILFVLKAAHRRAASTEGVCAP